MNDRACATRTRQGILAALTNNNGWAHTDRCIFLLSQIALAGPAHAAKIGTWPGLADACAAAMAESTECHSQTATDTGLLVGFPASRSVHRCLAAVDAPLRAFGQQYACDNATLLALICKTKESQGALSHRRKKVGTGACLI